MEYSAAERALNAREKGVIMMNVREMDWYDSLFEPVQIRHIVFCPQNDHT